MSKLQDLADALAKADPSVTIMDVGHYAGDAPERRETTVMKGGQTLGTLTETSNGRWAFVAPDDAKFNDVSPIIGALTDANVKMGDPEV